MTYKDIKHLHIGVYPPLGRVRVAAPERLDDDQVRLAVIQRLPWIPYRHTANSATALRREGLRFEGVRIASARRARVHVRLERLAGFSRQASVTRRLHLPCAGARAHREPSS